MNDLNINEVEVLKIDVENNESNKSGKIKLVFILLILFLVLFIGIGLFAFLKFAKDNVNISSKVKDMTIELGTKKEDISIKGCKLRLDEADLEKVGEYNYSAVCSGKEYKAKLIIKDTIAPEVEMKILNIEKGEVYEPEDTVLSYKDNSKVKFRISSDSSIYDGLNLMLISAIDEYDNETLKNAVIYVTNVKANKFINFSKVSSTTYNASLNIIDRIGFNSSNYYINAIRIYDYSFNSKKEYELIKNESINKNEINGIAGKIIYDDKNLNIKLYTELSKQELDLLNGNFPAVIDDITKLYISLNYTMKVEINKTEE